MSSVRTRFAPSPTGFLHIGGARTALFNFLFARHHGGRYLLRIEDTDRARSTDEAVEQILDSLEWLGLAPDEPPAFQSRREARHAEVARELLAPGAPTSPSTRRRSCRRRGSAPSRRAAAALRRRLARPRPGHGAAGRQAGDRLKAPREGETVVPDLVQGEVRVANAELDDMIILRSDGTPTYLHAVVVDDHDMGITHVIRGDDHLTNTFRQCASTTRWAGRGRSSRTSR
jgi:glutamyl-tRNA synthetase